MPYYICSEKDCNKRPYFNLKGETNPLYCATHKRENMINIKKKLVQKKIVKLYPVLILKEKKMVYIVLNIKKTK